VDAAMAEVMTTKAIIFDIRNYPNGTMYQISNYLNPHKVNFVNFTEPNLDYPGDFTWVKIYETGTENPDYYQGRVILLFDERTLSHAEFTCMALETAPDATKIGSQTAGADGNVSWVYFPGTIYTYFTGLGVYYPDGSPTQRIGIVPDIEVHPTVQGIQSGRDEVLEFAIQFIENN
jgi:C-terminal processing protease CtpA/Prc